MNVESDDCEFATLSDWLNIRELKHATFFSHGWQPEVNILQARTLVFPSNRLY